MLFCSFRFFFLFQFWINDFRENAVSTFRIEEQFFLLLFSSFFLLNVENMYRRALYTVIEYFPSVTSNICRTSGVIWQHSSTIRCRSSSIEAGWLEYIPDFKHSNRKENSRVERSQWSEKCCFKNCHIRTAPVGEFYRVQKNTTSCIFRRFSMIFTTIDGCGLGGLGDRGGEVNVAFK